MKVAILSDFPLHCLPPFGEAYRPNAHYPTWLPPLAGAFENHPELEIHWITPTRQVEAPVTCEWQGQTFHILPTDGAGRRATSFYRKDRESFRKILTELQPDVVHGWGSEDVHGLGAILSGYPHLVSMQGILSDYALHNKMHPREYFQAALEIGLFFKADLLTVESEWGRRILLRRNPFASVEVVEYGVEHFWDLAWTPDADAPTALFVGTLCKRKGIHDLVAAFADPRLARARLWVAGSGVDEAWISALKAAAPPNVEWLGRLSREELRPYLQKAWTLLLPTRADTSPNVVKEARVVGMPVITTPCGGQTTYIQDGEAGFLVPPGDRRALAEACVRMLSDFALCRKMGATHWEEHRAALKPSLTAEKFAALYRRLAGK